MFPNPEIGWIIRSQMSFHIELVLLDKVYVLIPDIFPKIIPTSAISGFILIHWTNRDKE